MQTTTQLNPHDVVKFRDPIDHVEAQRRMVVIENRETRVLVTDLEFVDNPRWPIPPTNMYATTDLERI